MKVLLSIVTLFLVQIAVAQNNKKAVFVIVDGIPADVLEKVQTPTLDSISAAGGYTRAQVGGEKGGYSQTPTISAVGYNSLLTGTWANKHNVWDNDIEQPNYAYPTIFRLFKEQYPERKTAIFSSWLDNRTKLVGEGLAATGSQQLDYKYDGLELDTIRFPHDRNRNFMLQIDESVVDSASAIIRSHAPDLTWVYLEYTDDMGHAFGDSEAFYHSVRLMDKQISRLWQAIRYREINFKEDWVIYITTDHGRTKEDGKGHGGQSERERLTWIVTDDDSLNRYFKSGKAAIVDIMPSLAAHLEISIPQALAFELDGVRLNRPISAINARASYENGKLIIQWESIDPTGQAIIHVSTTNKFAKSGKDEYREMGRVPAGSERAEINVKNIKSSFFKIVIEFPFNTLNRWVLVE